jgi:hypothetical protein
MALARWSAGAALRSMLTLLLVGVRQNRLDGSRRVIRGKGACSGSVSRSTILDHFVHDSDRSRHLASASEPDEDCAACWHSAALFAHSVALIIVVTPQEATEPQ